MTVVRRFRDALGSGLVVVALATASAAQEAASPAQSADAGARVFGSKGCGGCHAINGVGPSVGPDLGRSASARSVLELGSALWNHLPGMVNAMRERGLARTRMSFREAEDLTAFLSTIGYFSTPGDTARGRALFASKECVVCHRVGGAGGVVGPDLDFLGLGSPIHIAAAMWNHGSRMSGAMREAGVTRPTLTGAELADIIAYVRQAAEQPRAGAIHAMPGRREAGERLFRAKRCFECHGTPGRGGGRGPDLARRDRAWDLGGFAAALWNKAPAMTRAMAGSAIAVPELSAAEMADLIAYLAAARYFGQTGDAAAGRRALGTAGCAGCHAPNGNAARSAPNLTAVAGYGSEAALIAAFWNHAAVAFDGAAPAGGWKTIDPQTVADIAAYLNSDRSR